MINEENMEYLSIVLQTLKENQLNAKFSKCEFWLREVSFLGHVISTGGIVVDLSKMCDMLQWESMKSVIKIKSFPHRRVPLDSIFLTKIHELLVYVFSSIIKLKILYFSP